jgi:hypothetical protein
MTMSEDMPNAILVGEPDVIPSDGSLRHIHQPDQKIKLDHGNCHEHFVPTGDCVEIDGHRLTVYCWADRTYIAE